MRVIKEEPILDCIEVRSNPELRRNLIDVVAERLWWVVLGFMLGAVMTAL